MSIRSRDNLYNGINAHLHSRLQHEPGGWEVFHAAHIIDVGRAIDALLPLGYLIEPEKSLQIREYHPHENLTALGIWKTESGSEPPVTWFELLSPANKPPGDGYLQYREKRNATLHAGTALVEIDYLHEKRSPIMRLPSYPQQEEGAFPYTIVVTDPRPSLDDGQMKLYGMHVDDPLPSIPIPLRDPDTITLDTQPVYDLTYRSFGSYSQRVDYADLPENFERYSANDQARIKQRMKHIAETYE
jgi:hypothetical protein